jgi:hypothetical protein
MPQNNIEDFKRFRDLVFSDILLQKQLRELTDREEFIAKTVELGAARGFVFTGAEVLDIMRGNQQRWIERWI